MLFPSASSKSDWLVLSLDGYRRTGQPYNVTDVRAMASVATQTLVRYTSVRRVVNPAAGP